MSVAIYGGSFDPPHVAHVLLAQYLLSVGMSERVVVVPVFKHALSKQLTPFDLRLEMCRRAFAWDERISVSEVESHLSAPSYTLHTLQALAQEFPGERLRLVIGADVLAETKHWHRFDEVAKLAEPLVFGRAGVTAPDAPPPFLPDVSSSQARRWWRRSATADERRLREMWIPRGAREVIERTGLYGDDS